MLSGLAALLTLGLGTSGVIAQEQNERDEVRLEEILVTAEKREQSMQDVAISITAISGGDLARFSIKDFNDVVQFIPGLSTDSANNSVLTRAIGIRGVISQSGTILSAENAVGYYIDNTAISVNNARLVDLERVETLRGPQGTLYGSSTLAGLIKLVTKKPSFEKFSGHVNGEISTVKTGETGSDIEASVNIPLADNFAIRASAFREDIAGYIDARPVDLIGFTITGEDVPDINSIIHKGGRVAAYWEATENFRAHLSFMINDLKSDGTFFTDNYAPTLEGDRLVGFWRFPTGGNADDNLTSLEIEWEFPSFSIQSTTSKFNSYRETDELDTTNFFGLISTPIQVSTGTYQLTRDEFTQEVRILSTWDSKFNYILGGFYSKREQGYETRFPMIPGSTVFGFPNSPDGFIFWSSSTRLIKEKALFGMLTYDFNDKWSIAAGARVFEFDTELFDHFRGNLLFVSGGDSVLTGDSSASDIVSRFNLQYRPKNDLMLYATAAEGYRSGGSNFPLPANPICEAELLNKIGTPTAPSGYEPDSLWNYELGLKSTVAEGRVAMTLAVFLMDWTNMQIGVSPLCGLGGTTMNAGKVQSKGFEYELDAAVSENFTLGFGVAYIDATFSEDASFGFAFSYADEGSRIPNVAKWSGNIRANYRIPISDRIEGFVGGTLTYLGDRVAIPASGGSVPTVKDAYEVLNLRAGVVINDDWSVELFAENLTNSNPSFTGLPLAVLGTEIGGVPVDFSIRQQTFGLRLRFGF